jgi:ABC-type transport system involved in multi-copper enzyme maturation permease subunit
MWTVFVHTLKESIHRRIALSLIVVAVLFMGVQLGFTRFERDAKGELVVYRFGSHSGIAAKTFVLADARPEQVALLAGLWITLGLFAATPLLTSHMEKGWAELLLSKGTARWQIFAGRFAGAVALLVGTACIMNVVSVTYFSLRAGVPLKPYFIAVGVLFVSFLSALALLALVATVQPNATLLVMVVFLELIVTGVLRTRKEMYGIITARWAQWSLDWVYRILPKHDELGRMARGIAMNGTVTDWFPLWSTAIFVVVATGWAFWRFERKAF